MEQPALQMRIEYSRRELLLLEQFFQHGLLKQIQLRLVAEEAGLVDRQVLQQLGQFVLALVADQQPVVGVEGIGAAFLQAAQQPVLKKVGAALVEVHAALLVDERLQQLQFRFRQYGSRCRSGCAHALSRSRLTLKFQRSASLDPAQSLTLHYRAAAPRASALPPSSFRPAHF